MIDRPQHVLMAVLLVVAVVLGGFAAMAEASHETPGLYEKWNPPASCAQTSPPGTCLMRGDRWRTTMTFGAQEGTGEVVDLAPAGRAFRVRLRREGDTDLGDSGRRTSEYRLTPTRSLAIPALIDHVEVKFKVLSIQTDACSVNEDGSTPTRVRPALVRLSGFNDGTSPGAGNRIGDVFATIQAARSAASPDGAGVLRLEGFVSRCDHPTCSTAAVVSGITLSVPLPNVAAPPKFTLRAILDKPNHKFIVGVDAGGVTTNADLDYATVFPNDTAGSVQPFVDIGVSNSTANCTSASGGPTVADATTLIKKVKTNVSGLVP